jgi:hypothetical protein
MGRAVSSLRGRPASRLPHVVEMPNGLRKLIAWATTSPATWLVVVVGASTLVRAWISLGVASPWVLPDEVLYSDLAKSIGAGERPSVRGVPVLGWGVVYPSLIAPIWALFENPFFAYHATLVVNAFVMSLAAVPAYFLARLFVSRKASLLVALMTVLVPSMSYTGALMTENAFYPLFLLAVLLIARTVSRPSTANQAAVLLLLGLVALTRIQGLALAAAYVGAVVTYAWTSGPSEGMGYVRRFLPTAAVTVPLALVPAVVSFARGDGAFGWLGARSRTFDGLHPEEVPQWLAFLAADLVLYVAVVPVAATAVMVGVGLSRRAPESARLFSAVALSTGVAMLVSVALVSASFDADGIESMNERYLFYVVPITFLGLVAWVDAGLPRPRPWAWIIVAGCCLLPVLMPINRLDYNAGLQALALLPWGALSVSDLSLALLLGVYTLACGTLWLRSGRSGATRLWLLSAVWMVLLGAFAIESNADSGSKAARAFEGRKATWVDNALPPGAEVDVLWNQRLARQGVPDWFYYWLMVTELFNRNVGDVYRVGPTTYFENVLPTVPVRIQSDMTVADASGRTVDVEYVLVTCRTGVAGEIVAGSPRGGFELVRVQGALRLVPRRVCSPVVP